MKKKSIGINAILNVIKSLMAIVFPLITFPYVSKILQVDNLGKYNFASSVVSYFSLLAGLGISTYAIREGSRVRGDKKAISKFASEIFTINLISTICSYIILLISLIFIPKLQRYSTLIAILSVGILFTTIGTEWIYSIYEEYAYITIRSILFQILSLILMFIFIKEEGDYVLYAVISIVSSIGSNIINFVNARKYCRIGLTRTFNWRKHLKPILILFASSLATSIYVNSDMLLLGFMTSDYNVGLYSVSEKVYRVVKTMLGAVLIVSVPRLSNYLGNGEKEKYNNALERVFNVIIITVVPVVIGLVMLSRQVVLIISDVMYLEAIQSLRILSFALIFALFNWIFSTCVLIPYKQEKKVLLITILSALINFVLNLLMISIWKENAAAFTTLIAEAFSMFMYIYYIRGYVDIHISRKDIISIIIGCIAIVLVCFGMGKVEISLIYYTLTSILSSAFVYFVVLVLFKNNTVMQIMHEVKKKLKIN